MKYLYYDNKNDKLFLMNRFIKGMKGFIDKFEDSPKSCKDNLYAKIRETLFIRRIDFAEYPEEYQNIIKDISADQMLNNNVKGTLVLYLKKIKENKK